MNICEKYFIPDNLTEEEAIEWAKNQAVLFYKDDSFEFIYECDFLNLLESYEFLKLVKSEKYDKCW